jgi:hypothetical protein
MTPSNNLLRSIVVPARILLDSVTNTRRTWVKLAANVTWFMAVAIPAVVATAAAFVRLGRPEHGIDDAQTTLKYADNLARGAGFVFNPGGERVEGSSSLLWTLICAAFARARLRDGMLLPLCCALMACSLLAPLLFVTSTLRSRRVVPSRETIFWSGAFIVVWGVTSAEFVTWTTVTLMDTSLWSCVFTCGTLLFSRSARSAPSVRGDVLLSLAVAVALVTRPEAMAFAALWIVALATQTLVQTKAMWTALRRGLAPSAAYALTLAGLTTFRVAYFGFPLPNTYYAKVSPRLGYNVYAGLRYVASFLGEHPIVVGCCAFSVLSIHACLVARPSPDAGGGPPATTGGGEDCSAWFIVSIVALAGVVYPVIIGGDHFCLHRFFQPVWPLLVVPPVLFIATRQPRLLRAALRGSATRVVLGSALLVAPSSWRTVSYLEHEFWLTEEGLARGQRLNEIFVGGELPSVGEIAVGSVGRAYRGKMIDLMGLNNVAMGHSPGDRTGEKNHAAFNTDVFFQLAPDLILPYVVPYEQGRNAALKTSVNDVEWETKVLKGLTNTAEFRRRYVRVMLLPGADVTRKAILVWCKRDLVSRIEAQGLRVIPFAAP